MKRLSLAAAALLLAACSGGEPSNADIKAALDHELNKANDMMKQQFDKEMEGNPQAAAMFGDSFQVKVENIEKTGDCEKQDAAYVCNVKMSITMPMVGTQTQTAPLHLVKTGGTWTVAGGM